MFSCLLQGRVELSVGFHARAEPIAAAHGFWNLVVLPGSEFVEDPDIVSGIVTHHHLFDAENTVIEQQDDGVHIVASHRPNLVGCKLMASISLNQYNATRWIRQRCPESGRSTPTDRAPDELVEVDCVLRQEKGGQGGLSRVRVYDQNVIRRQELLYSR